MFNTPILFLTFNKLEETKRVFKKIKEIKPSRLYVMSDGPRVGREEDSCIETIRSHILSEVDWDCHLKTIFHEENKGCKTAVSGAISDFFVNEEFGIILEDDCLPSNDFFIFMERMLIKFKDDNEVFAVCGYKPMKELPNPNNECYYFSKNISFWGWGTWRDRWSKFDYDMKDYPKLLDSGRFRKLFSRYVDFKANKMAFDQTYNNQNSSWGYRWAYSIIKNQGRVIFPHYNLIVNIGFKSKNATHTKQELPHYFSCSHESMPTMFNENYNKDYDVADALYSQKVWRIRVFKDLIKKIPLLKKVYRFLK
ncbi:hypothetical protein [Vibrio sp. 1640]|uniref:hypothetical protein n=1 Tax=Vibrio sp. 1640 TaxID=3074570 RepID=UPI00296438FF|nr:hypothetical protein [Vibrio sp. 1640]MDW2080739.1 hypothetical protein [Vibrio sp. 1640]